jgi:hypothetical protein
MNIYMKVPEDIQSEIDTIIYDVYQKPIHDTLIRTLRILRMAHNQISNIPFSKYAMRPVCLKVQRLSSTGHNCPPYSVGNGLVEQEGFYTNGQNEHDPTWFIHYTRQRYESKLNAQFGCNTMHGVERVIDLPEESDEIFYEDLCKHMRLTNMKFINPSPSVVFTCSCSACR